LKSFEFQFESLERLNRVALWPGPARQWPTPHGTVAMGPLVSEPRPPLFGATLSFCNFLICQLSKLSGWLGCASDLGIDNFLSALDTSNFIGSDLAPCASPTYCFTSLPILAKVVVVTFGFFIT
jgi:hypothetical protein